MCFRCGQVSVRLILCKCVIELGSECGVCVILVIDSVNSGARALLIYFVCLITAKQIPVVQSHQVWDTELSSEKLIDLILCTNY